MFYRYHLEFGIYFSQVMQKRNQSILRTCSRHILPNCLTGLKLSYTTIVLKFSTTNIWVFAFVQRNSHEKISLDPKQNNNLLSPSLSLSFSPSLLLSLPPPSLSRPIHHFMTEMLTLYMNKTRIAQVKWPMQCHTGTITRSGIQKLSLGVVNSDICLFAVHKTSEEKIKQKT